MDQDCFDILLLIGRPASGKSEIIDYLTHAPAERRRRACHVGDLDVMDDFPMLWTWFEEDALLVEKFGLPRLHTDEQGYFKYPELWHLLIERLSLDYGKRVRDHPDYHDRSTVLIEFSRGTQQGGYREAFEHLSDEILSRAVILYVRVSFEESLRKNRRRFNPNRPDSILEHGLSDEKMERLYRQDDWSELVPDPHGFLQIREHAVPYTIFENEDDVTTGRPDQLATRLQTRLEQLWELHQQR
ncbi:MAG: hypothetical protein JXB85_04835 [Anaerolineales bacterium]|nr:hypothetical protein [Anaerolineales bacterium]